MTVLVHAIFGSVICVALGACDKPASVDPAENAAEYTAETIIPNSAEPLGPQEAEREAAGATLPRSNSAEREPNMPKPETNSSSSKPAAPRPWPDVKPSPWQPPAEVDPPHEDPGNEPPR